MVFLFMLHHQFRNQIVIKAGAYCKTACLIQNMAGKRLNSDSGKLETNIEPMKVQQNTSNGLAKKIKTAN